MGGVYTIYSYFNSEQIQGVLNAIVMLVGSGGTDGDYLSIVRVAAMLGLFLAVTYGFVKARGEDAGYYLLMVAIFYSTLFVPRVTVTIEERGGTGGAPLVVANVPIGLAFFASTTSHIGSWLTERTETFFSLPSDELKLQKNGLMGGSRALRNLQSASFQDPILAQDLILFMRECVNPELLASPSYVETLLRSNSIWTEIGPAGLNLVNPGRMVSLIGEAGAISCSDAYTNTTPRINAQATKEHGRIATLISPSVTPTTADAILTALIPAQESLIMTASATTADAIKQRMMINMLNDAPGGIASMMNDPAAAQIALGASAATSSANTAYAVMAKLAQETLPVIRNAIELVIIGVFPIILLLIIIAGSKGGIVLRSYVMTMLWVQLWAPLYAIVNYVGVMAASKSMKAALAGVDGVCVMNAAQLLNSTISAEGIAGMLTISVPMIALALVKGGEVAMSGVTSGLSAPSNSAASSVGSQIGMGNVSMGNTSWGNHSSNSASSGKYDTNFAYRGGMAGVQDNSGNFMSYAPDGSRRVDMLTNKGPLSQRATANAGTALQEAAASTLTSAVADIRSAAEGLSTVTNKMFGKGSNVALANSNGRTFNTLNTASEGTGDTLTFSHGQITGKTASNTSGMNVSTGVDIAAQAGTKGNISKGKDTPKNKDDSGDKGENEYGASWNVGVGGSVAKTYLNNMNKAIQRGDTKSALHAANQLHSILDSYSHSSDFGDRKTGTDTRRSEFTAALSKAKQKIDSASASLTKADSLMEQAARTMGTSTAVSLEASALSNNYLEQVKGVSDSSGSGLVSKLEEKRNAEYGPPSRPDQYMSGKPALNQDQLDAQHKDNKEASNLNPDIEQTFDENSAEAGAGLPQGRDAVPRDKNAELNHLNKRGEIAAEAGEDYQTLKRTTDAAAEEARKFMPNGALSKNYSPIIFSDNSSQVANVLLSLSADGQAPFLSLARDFYKENFGGKGEDKSEAGKDMSGSWKNHLNKE